MGRRDYVAEIASRRARILKRGTRFDQLTRRVDDLIDMAQFLTTAPRKVAPFKLELAKYLPIGWVACIEGYFRLVYRDLIDHGSPFRDNVTALKDIKIGLDHVVAMEAGRLTLGEFVSHLLPANGLGDINESMSAILGKDFLTEVKHIKTDVFEHQQSLVELDLAGVVLESVQRLFEQRHVFAHELASKVRVSIKEVVRDSRAALILIDHTETLVSRCIVAVNE